MKLEIGNFTLYPQKRENWDFKLAVNGTL